MFAPGISQASIATLPDDLPEGSIVAIGTTSVPNAIRGIGRLCMHSSNLKANPAGKAVEVLHVEGDQLWALGNKSTAQPRAVKATTDEQVHSDNVEVGNVGTIDTSRTEMTESNESSASQSELTTAGMSSW